MNAAQDKTVNLRKTFFFGSSVFVSVCVFEVWPRGTERLDTPVQHLTLLGGQGPRGWYLSPAEALYSVVCAPCNTESRALRVPAASLGPDSPHQLCSWVGEGPLVTS